MRPVALLASGLFVFASFAAAAEPPAGDFRLESGVVRPTVARWGPDCGPAEPQIEQWAGGGGYRLDGDRLVPADRGRPLFGPGICAQASGLRGLRESKADGEYRCTSAPDSGKTVEGRVRLRAVDLNTVEVTHFFDYDWTLKGSHCEVRIEGRFTLARVERLAPADPCASPGPVARLEVAGRAERLVRPDGRVRLEVSARDAQGCALPALRPMWSTTAGDVDPEGVFSARGLEPGARAVVRAALGAVEASFTVVVAAAGAPASFDGTGLAAVDPALDAETVALPAQAGEGLDAGATAAPAGDATRARLLVVVFVAFATIAAALGLLIAWRTLAQRRRPMPLDFTPTPLADPDRLAPPEGHQCPRCGDRYPADARFCGRDGSVLGPGRP